MRSRVIDSPEKSKHPCTTGFLLFYYFFMWYKDATIFTIFWDSWELYATISETFRKCDLALFLFAKKYFEALFYIFKIAFGDYFSRRVESANLAMSSRVAVTLCLFNSKTYCFVTIRNTFIWSLYINMKIFFIQKKIYIKHFKISKS